jgi:phosphatidate cytidylyltransferase
VLVTRLATAAVGIPLIVLTIWLGGAVLAAVVAVAVSIAVIEIAMARGVPVLPRLVEGPGRIRDVNGGEPRPEPPVELGLGRTQALLAALLAGALPAAALAGEQYVLAGVVAAIALQSAFYTRTRDPRADLPQWLWGVATCLYFGALASYFVLIREAPDGRDWLFFTVLAVWVTDTGAYALGRAIGRHKLAPAVSPGKTWEGAAGSMLAGFAAVFVLNEAFDLRLALEHRVALGLALPAVIMMGDLAESALKRGLEIKDSSGLVPGHGGIADRLDSLLFAAPAVYYYLKWIVS